MALTALMGTYHHNIDAKGRMSFPTKLRDLLGGEFYVTKSINQKCLTIYSKSEWEKLANKIAELPDSMGGLDIKRWLFSGAGELGRTAEQYGYVGNAGSYAAAWYLRSNYGIFSCFGFA